MLEPHICAKEETYHVDREPHNHNPCCYIHQCQPDLGHTKYVMSCTLGHPEQRKFAGLMLDLIETRVTTSVQCPLEAWESSVSNQCAARLKWRISL